MVNTTSMTSENGIRNEGFEKDENETYELNGITTKTGQNGTAIDLETKPKILLSNKYDDEESEAEANRCGLGLFSPDWIQKHATKRMFIIVFGILGVIQSMSWAYFSATLTTLEKRFRLSSRTAGIVMSGNELSQVVFSIILSYYGTKGHRPRWIAIGVLLSSIACFLLASPHIIYGSGKMALSYTTSSSTNINTLHMSTFLNNIIATTDPSSGAETVITGEFKKSIKKYGQPCLGPEMKQNKTSKCDANSNANDDFTIYPLVLIFLSQFASGIGNILFFTLGGPYLDDNTKKDKLPMVFGITYCFRLIGPTLGYLLASGCLKLFINPLLNPVIENNDPRWIGAWWLGWIICGVLMAFAAFFIALFPRELPNAEDEKKVAEEVEDGIVKISELPNAIKVLIKNKINVLNTLAGVFYLFSAVGYWTYAPKYLETIFLQSASNASIISGVVGIVFQAAGFLGSGIIISKWKPRARILAGWNVMIAFLHVGTMIIFTQIGCNPGKIEFGTNTVTEEYDTGWNLTSTCNIGCGCENNKVLPVCFQEQNKVFFSPCHAGCSNLYPNGTLTNCSCLDSPTDTVQLGTCSEGCFTTFFLFLVVTALVKALDSTGRIGNTLVAYRCVSKHERSLSIGISIFLISIFALLPAPIVFGALVDSVCLIWNKSECQSGNGNCLFYDGEKLRYVFNLTASVFIFLGGILDCFVWYYVKDLELYSSDSEDQEQKITDKEKKNKSIGP